MLARRHQHKRSAAATQFENDRRKFQRFRPGTGNGDKSVT